MIDEICKFTRNKEGFEHILKYNELINIDLSEFNYSKYIEYRQSFRNFKNDSEVPLNIVSNLIKTVHEIKERILFNPEIVKVGFIDNKHVISESSSIIYIFENNEFKNIGTAETITKENLFIQSEMHDADGVIFFLWDINKLNEKLTVPNFIYKEMLITSGLLGQLTSIVAINNNLKGTPFAGIIHPEWRILTESYKNQRPIFAYAFINNT